MRPMQHSSRVYQLFRATVSLALLLFVSAVLFQVASPLIAFAQGETNDFGITEVDSQIALSGDSIVVVILRVIRIMLGFLGLVLVILVLYAGYTIMTSAGNEEKVEQGKTILKNVVIGTAIILFSFIIVQFAINVLSDASGIQHSRDSQGVPGIKTFTGYGSLGKVIQDHYPRPNQTGVYRNTKIVVTFSDDINPASIIENTNGSCWGPGDIATTTASICDAEGAQPYYGDCVEGVCDMLNTSTIKIERIIDQGGETNGGVIEAVASVAYDSGSAHTFVFKPTEFLGNDQADEWHRVTITNDVLTTANVGVFDRAPESFYKWEFQTNTEVDLTPPYVVDISPNAGDTIAKNTILKIVFNEPVDPLVVQGTLGGSSSFANIVFGITGGTDITGSWKITNGYQTVEFVSDEACGINSCGETIFCLPTGCEGDDDSCKVEYTVLARTASLKDPNGTTFESSPSVFNGVRDLADNAMDSKPEADGSTLAGNKDFIIQEGPEGSVWRHRPFNEINHPVLQPSEKTADNFWWSFFVSNTIDTEVPYVTQVYPGIDQQSVEQYAPVDVFFSKEMWEDTLTGVVLEEYPQTSVGLGYRRSMTTSEGTRATRLTLLHPARPFGPGGKAFHYFVSVPGTVKANNQFCMYPGRGPDVSEACIVTYSETGEIDSVPNCIPDMNFASSTDTGCLMANGEPKTASDVAACLSRLRVQAEKDLRRTIQQ